MERLRQYAWPGNVRELQSVVKQSLLRASGTVLLPAFLPGLQDPPESAGRQPETDRDRLDDLIGRRLTSAAPDLYCRNFTRTWIGNS